MRLGYSTDGLIARAIQMVGSVAAWAGPWYDDNYDEYRRLDSCGASRDFTDLSVAVGQDIVEVELLYWQDKWWALLIERQHIGFKSRSPKPLAVPLGSEPTDPVAVQCAESAARVLNGPSLRGQHRLDISQWHEDGVCNISTHSDYRDPTSPRGERVLVRSERLAEVLVSLDPVATRGFGPGFDPRKVIRDVMLNTPADYDQRLCQWVLR